jgi:hypothetical protein
MSESVREIRHDAVIINPAKGDKGERGTLEQKLDRKQYQNMPRTFV